MKSVDMANNVRQDIETSYLYSYVSCPDGCARVICSVLGISVASNSRSRRGLFCNGSAIRDRLLTVGIAGLGKCREHSYLLVAFATLARRDFVVLAGKFGLLVYGEMCLTVMIFLLIPG